jgi:hypothetical protein
MTAPLHRSLGSFPTKGSSYFLSRWGEVPQDPHQLLQHTCDQEPSHVPSWRHMQALKSAKTPVTEGYGYTSHPPLLIIATPFTIHRTPGIGDALSA